MNQASPISISITAKRVKLATFPISAKPAVKWSQLNWRKFAKAFGFPERTYIDFCFGHYCKCRGLKILCMFKCPYKKECKEQSSFKARWNSIWNQDTFVGGFCIYLSGMIVALMMSVLSICMGTTAICNPTTFVTSPCILIGWGIMCSAVYLEEIFPLKKAVQELQETKEKK